MLVREADAADLVEIGPGDFWHDTEDSNRTVSIPSQVRHACRSKSKGGGPERQGSNGGIKGVPIPDPYEATHADWMRERGQQ